MAVTFIPGAAGAGKTSVGTELARRDFTVYDTDDPLHTGIAGWHDLETGNYVAGFNELKLTPELLNTHIWKLTDAALSDFRSRSTKERIYLNGRLRDPEAVIEVSKYVVFLCAPS